jgi:rhomboid protease GluP
VGASSSIFGLVAAEGIFIYRNRAYLGSKAGGMLSNILFIVAINLFFGFSSTGIDNFGHLGGLISGLVFAWLAGPVLAVEQHTWGYKLVNTVEEKHAWLVALGLTAALIFLALLGIEQGIIPL